MSAPLRSIDAESNPWLAKRRNRTKRFDVDQSRNFPLYFENNNRATGKDERTTNDRTRSKLTLKTNNDTGNCDIVTLVSLLSPGASDSEKEDTSQTKVEPKVSPSPARRRIEKSGMSSRYHWHLIWYDNVWFDQFHFKTMMSQRILCKRSFQPWSGEPPLHH